MMMQLTRPVSAAGNIMDTSFNSRNKVISCDAIDESVCKCQQNMMWEASVWGFVVNVVESELDLVEDLQNGTYKGRPPKHHKIYWPKERDIVSISFRDRVYQRSLNDNVLYPAMSRSFIYDNAACQTGKGTDFARNRLKAFLQRYFRKFGNDGWVAQKDIHGYYPNMQHEAVAHKFRKHLDDWSYAASMRVFSEQYPGDVGYNPGSQMVQIAGISLPDEIDHKIKEGLHVTFYGRYMDDSLDIANDRNYLEFCLEEEKKMYAEIGCELHPEKTRIYPLKQGIPYLGFIFKLTDTGKVLMLLNPDKIKDEKNKLRRMVSKAKRGELARENVFTHYKSIRAYIECNGNNHKLVMRFDAYFKRLWEDKHVKF